MNFEAGVMVEDSRVGFVVVYIDVLKVGMCGPPLKLLKLVSLMLIVVNICSD